MRGPFRPDLEEGLADETWLMFRRTCLLCARNAMVFDVAGESEECRLLYVAANGEAEGAVG